MLLDNYPKEKYSWLINVAYMTLGLYPEKVPEKYFIQYPNKNLEAREFPAFKDVSMNLGVAVNGLSGGTCIEDFNNDGLLDIFATSYGMEDQVKLFINDGKGSFNETTNEANLKGLVGGLNTIHADYNNDGNVDILILRGGWLGKGGTHPNSLLKNNGDGTFSDVTKSSGIYSKHPTQTACWADYDRDGFLDLFIGNESKTNDRHKSEFYKNNGDGTFTEVSATVGLGNISAFVKGTSWGDINNDQFPDLFISVMGGKNLLYLNNQGTFEEIGESAGIQKPLDSFPCWFWDVNNDGFQDIFVSGYPYENLNDVADDFARELKQKEVKTDKPRLYINNGNNTFSDVSIKNGVSKTMYSMGANFGDLDNDGWLDFYVGTGAPDFSTIVPNRMFHNSGNGKFEEVTAAGGFGHIQKGHGIGFGDLDNDGDQDIYAVMGGAYEGDEFTNVLFNNPSKAKNNWITVELEGSSTNKKAIGTVIEIQLENGRKIFRTVGTGGSFGASSLQQEIGLGKAKSIAKLIVHWQNSKAQTFENIATDQKVLITEGNPEVKNVVLTPIVFSTEEMNHHHH